MFLYDEKDDIRHVITRRTFKLNLKNTFQKAYSYSYFHSNSIEDVQEWKVFYLWKMEIFEKNHPEKWCAYKKPNLMHIWSLTYSLGTIGKCISVVPIFYPCFPQRKYPILTSKRKKHSGEAKSSSLPDIFFAQQLTECVIFLVAWHLFLFA